MARKPEFTLEQLTFMMIAWRKHHPTEAFGGVTLEQFSAAVQELHECEAEAAVLDEVKREKQAQLDAEEAKLLPLLDRIEAEMKAYLAQQKEKEKKKKKRGKAKKSQAIRQKT